MKRNKLAMILFLFCFVTSYSLYPCPKDCVECWLKFKNSPATIILPFETAANNTYMISLSSLKSEIEKWMKERDLRSQQ